MASRASDTCRCVLLSGALVASSKISSWGLWSNRSGDHNSLLLPSRDTALAFGNNRKHPHWHGPDIIGNACCFRSLPGFLQSQEALQNGTSALLTSLWA
jgi:hypothetical protein